jgi:PTS system nitrogen regulatory IIA component
MNLIAQLLTPSQVIVELDATSKKRVFEQVGLLFENTLHITHNQVFDSLLDRKSVV